MGSYLLGYGHFQIISSIYPYHIKLQIMANFTFYEKANVILLHSRWIWHIYCILYTLIHKKDEGCSNIKSDENRNSKMKTIIYQRLTLFKVTTYMHLLMMYRAWHEMTMCDLICHHRLHSVSRISLNCSPTGDNQKILQFTFCIWTVWIDHSAKNGNILPTGQWYAPSAIVNVAKM